MKKTKKPKNPKYRQLLLRTVLATRISITGVAGFLLAVLPAMVAGYQLEDISLATGPTQSSIKLSFTKGGAEGEYPLYFQKADPSRGTLTLSFLDTESPFPLGRHPVEPANPAVEEILLKRITSPSGKNFLGIELRLKEPPTGEAPVQPQPQGALKVLLGKGGKGKVSWSLAKAMKSRDEYLTAKAEPVPPSTVANKVEAQPGPASAPAPSAEESSESAPGSLKEIRMAVTRTQEDITLVFDPPSSTPVHTAQASAADSSVLEVTLDGISSALPRKEYLLPRSGLFRKVRIAPRNGNLVLRFHRSSNDPVHILPQAGALTLTGGGKGESAVPFKWTTLKPDAAPPQVADASPDPVKSAHEEGAVLDAAAGGKPGKGKGLSSSRIFSLGKGGKNMILLKDSAALKSGPAPKARTQRKIPLGEKVERIDRQGPWIKVVSNGDTGFIRAAEAVYEDEMTEAQASALRKGMEAIAARVEAARKKAEQASASTDSRPVQESPDPAAGVEAAEPVRVAGPAAVPSSKAIPGEEPAQSPKGGKSANDPKLSLGENSELADKAAQEKKRAEDEKMRVEPAANRVAYNSYGRRDPFIPVEQGMLDNGIDIDQMKVVGIIWQAQEPMAVLEHNRESNLSFTVKQGDPVHNGRVSRITRDQVTFDISEYGISRSYSLKLVSNKEGKKQ